MDSDTGLLVVGHGTCHETGQQQLKRLFAQVSVLVSPRPVELAFLELAEPDIATAVRRLAEKGASKLVTIPVLLFSAGHALHDIPAAVEEAASAQGLTVVGQTPVLGTSEVTLELSAARFRTTAVEAILDDLKNARPKNAEAEKPLLPVGLAMIGRGSGSLSATAEMLRFTELRCKMSPVAWCTTGFIQLQSPTVEQALDALENCGQRILIVQPHLLFEGELTSKLRALVAARQLTCPSQIWRITEPLGDDESLARILVSLMQQAVYSEPEGS